MESTGLIVVAAVLVLGTAAGLWRRRADGRLRSAKAPTAATARPLPGASSFEVAVSPPGGVESPSDATAARPDAAGVADPSAAGERIDPVLLQALGVQPAPATLLQFSTAFCAPCRSVRRISSEVADLLPGVQHVEVDAESHLAAVRALGIWRTPTLLVLDADGRVTKRATGVPGKPQLIAALADLLPAR
jgi:thiol-disulfide isomerase/thioredoxin